MDLTTITLGLLHVRRRKAASLGIAITLIGLCGTAAAVGQATGGAVGPAEVEPTTMADVDSPVGGYTWSMHAKKFLFALIDFRSVAS